MFRRQTTHALNGRRWVSHRSGPRKSSYALTRGAVVATYIAAVGAATIAGQTVGGSSIHNDASSPGVTAAASSKVNPGTRVRVDGGVNNDEEELGLLVWGSNRWVCRVQVLWYHLHLRSPILAPKQTRRSWSFNLPFSHILLLLIRANDEISSMLGRASSPLMSRMRHRYERQR
jgi:hypothetical protein